MSFPVGGEGKGRGAMRNGTGGGGARSRREGKGLGYQPLLPVSPLPRCCGAGGPGGQGPPGVASALQSGGAPHLVHIDG